MDELGELAKEVVLPPAHHLELDPVMDETDVEIVSASVAETREQLLALISYLRHPALVDADALRELGEGKCVDGEPVAPAARGSA